MKAPKLTKKINANFLTTGLYQIAQIKILTYEEYMHYF